MESKRVDRPSVSRQKIAVATRIIITVVFVVLLAAPFWLGRTETSEGVDEAGTRKEEAISLFGFYLENVTMESGVDFRHEMAELDPKLDHILAQIASMGASVSVCDFDRDGWSDFYLTNSRYGSANGLYHNLQNGQFEDVASAMGVGDLNIKGTGVSMGSVWCDYDNDGFEDLFVYKWGKPELFRNIGGEKFERVPEGIGLPEWVNSNTAIWFDYDRDGWADLFIGGYYRESLDLYNLPNTVIMPESYEYANNGGRNYLLHNMGDGTFKDVTGVLGLNSTRWTLAVGAVDVNNDGYQDLVIANDYATDELYLNRQGASFIEIGKEAGIGYAPKSGMNVSFGDVNNLNQVSLYISNITETGVLLQGNNLWTPFNEGGKIKFRNEARSRGVESGGWSYGSQFGDLNNDGFLDLYVANGYISGIKGSSYWYDYSKITGGNKSIISDAANWPPMEGRSQSGYQVNKIWMNNGEGAFADLSEYVAKPEYWDSRAVALADLWNRGVLDVLVANQNNQPSIYRNNVDPGHHWIAFELQGTKSNGSAIGAEVALYWNDRVQMQVVSGGIGFSAQNQRRIHFGLGEKMKVDSVYIQWPSGMAQVLRQPGIDQLHMVIETP